MKIATAIVTFLLGITAAFACGIVGIVVAPDATLIGAYLACIAGMLLALAMSARAGHKLDLAAAGIIK